MARKARKGRGILITLCVIAGLFIIAVAAVRLFLTREKLLAIVIPRIERTLDAKVSIGDIGINFPFGLGVDITALSFEKTLPDTSALTFASEKVTVRSSLMSLLRRKPEIKAADVQGGSVTLTNPKNAREIGIRGLGAQLSMQPAQETFALSVNALADSVLVSAIGAPPALTLEKVGFDGEIESDQDMTRIVVKKSKLSWGDLVAATIEGEVTNVRTEPRVALDIEADDRPLGPVLEKIKTFKLAELSSKKQQAAGPQQPPAPVEISGGAFGFDARIEGLARQPLAMSVVFDGHLKDASVKSGDLASIGALNAELKGQGVALAWMGLFPGLEKPVTPAEIGMAWQAVDLDATIEIEGGEFVLQSKSAPAGAAATATSGGATPAAAASPQPIRVSAMKARVELSGPDVKKISGEFLIGSSPYRFEGSMINIMPAAAELALVGKRLAASGQKQLPDPGTVLDGLANAPIVKLEVSGRAFDAQPYQKPLFGPSGGAASPAPAAPPPAQAPSSAPSSAPAAALLFLKNTTFTAKLDSVITREAVFTDLEGKGTIRDGRIRIEPATFKYAGGKGAANVSVDARRTARVETKIDLAVEGIEASQALGRISSKGGMVQGKFSFKSNGTVATGPGINPVAALSAAGSALSSQGSVSIGNFLEPLAKIPGFDVTPFREFSFKDWTGNFVVRDGRCATDDWKVASSRGDWTIKGSFGFDGTLDYAVHVVLPPSVQAQMKGIDQYKAAFDLMRDKSGNLILDIHVRGSAKHPSATLDLTKAKSKAQERALEGLKKLLK